MNIVIKSVALLSMGVLLAQCAKEDPTVVQFKDGYSVTKPKAGTRDKAPEVNLLDQYASFTVKEQETNSLIKIANNATTVVSNPSFKVAVQTSFPAKEAVVLKLAYDAEKGTTSGKKLIPAESLEIPATVTVAKDTQEATVDIKLKDDALKTLEPGTYSFYLKLTTDDTSVQFKNAERQELLVSIIVREDKSNLEQGNEVIVGTAFRNVTFDSNYQSSRLSSLNDVVGTEPNLFSNWWINTQASDPVYLQVSFPSVQTIKGIHIVTFDPDKTIGTVNIKMASGNQWIDQGTYELKAKPSIMNPDIYIKFREPITTQYLDLSGFTSFDKTQQYIDIHDIEFIK